MLVPYLCTSFLYLGGIETRSCQSTHTHFAARNVISCGHPIGFFPSLIPLMMVGWGGMVVGLVVVVVRWVGEYP